MRLSEAKPRWALCGLQVIFPDFSVEGSLADTEDFCGLFAVSFGFSEGLGDGLHFELVEGDARQTVGALRWLYDVPRLGFSPA